MNIQICNYYEWLADDLLSVHTYNCNWSWRTLWLLFQHTVITVDLQTEAESSMYMLLSVAAGILKCLFQWALDCGSEDEDDNNNENDAENWNIMLC